MKRPGELFVTDRTRIARLPLREGYCLLVSVAEPEDFLEEARALWSAK